MDDCWCGYITKVGGGKKKKKKKTGVKLVSLSIFNLLNLMKDIVFLNLYGSSHNIKKN
jgi:hypothetical protein